MDLKKKMKAFFTLKRRANDGFTLVELIVVIAILAILGGVAVPAYSGYVTKAELAADEALLNEVNMAFASACAINGAPYENRTDDPQLLLNAENTVNGITTSENAINEAFLNFFESDDAAFNEQYKFSYDPVGMFVMKVARTATVNGIEYVVALDSANAYRDSIFNEIGTQTLLEEVDALVKEMADAKFLNLDAEGNEGFKEFCEELGISNTDAEKKKWNALVLYTAQNSGNLDGQALYESGLSMGNLSGTDKVAAQALSYAVGMAYMQEMESLSSTQGLPDDYVRGDITKSYVDQNMQTQSFKNWFAENGQSAIDGYLGAMDMIADNTDNLTDTQIKLIINQGFDNENAGLADIINGVLEQTK